jgi:hypothetical protein
LLDLFSFYRITGNSGWSIAALGIMVDLTGMVLLALSVILVPKLSGLMGKTRTALKKSPGRARFRPITESQQSSLSREGIQEIADAYRECAGSLGEVFQLSELYRYTEENGLPHPHLTIKALRESGHLVPEGNGRFRWRD